jgi:hypothetical protein
VKATAVLLVIDARHVQAFVANITAAGGLLQPLTALSVSSTLGRYPHQRES